MKGVLGKGALIGFVIVMFYLMLFSDSFAGRLFALAVYSLIGGLWAASEGVKAGVREAFKVEHLRAAPLAAPAWVAASS